jgi:hypothetical protein
MSNKDFNKLWDADKFIRKLSLDSCPEGHCVTLLKIEFIRGFELFNTRSYHNYESWGDGYRVSDGEITVEAEDLDDALKLFDSKRREK